MNLSKLTTLILSLNAEPLTRIRLGKTIYFVHKELIRKGFMTFDDIAYIRLPLGPTPQGLPELLTEQTTIIVSQAITSNLFYETEAYTIPQPKNQSKKQPAQATEGKPSGELADFSPEIIAVTKKILQLLQAERTVDLVRASQDSSWGLHSNGEIYHLTPLDLKNTFPINQIRFKLRIKPPANEIGTLQATLLRGMIADIVKESTDLEYPDEPPSTTSTETGKIHKITIKLPHWPKKKAK